MRVTASSFYNNIYGENNKLNRQLFDVNKQIASGQKIQYAHEDPGVFIDTLRLDDEITTLEQTKSSAQNAYKFSTQTDTTIGEIVKTLESMKVKLINAANDTNSDASLQAIAKEMRGLQNHLKTLANTSIAGQYLFSGTATAEKTIDANGVYQGNAKDMLSFLGSGIKQKYNISGTQLFFGEESQTNRTITTNVPLVNLTNTTSVTYITSSNTIGDLMGNTAASIATSSHFYLNGTKTDGTSFKKHITLNDSDSVDTLLSSIKNAYGTDQVDVSMNTQGQIQIVDKQNGSSKLDFHMVGAKDFNTLLGDAADVTNIDNLQSGTADFITASNATTPGLFIKEFTKSGFSPSAVTNTIEGINYDRTNFTQTGANLVSNISQIVNSDNSYAKDSTRLGAVASGTTYVNPPSDRYAGLNGQVIQLTGTGANNVPYAVSINLLDAGSTVTGTVNGAAVNFDIKDATDTITDAGKMTYRQLMDVVNLVVTNNIPSGAADDYGNKILTANGAGSVNLDYSGKIVFNDKSTTVTKAKISLYDNASSDFTGAIAGITGSILNFNANSALTIRDPKTDFFAQVEAMIKSVEEGKKNPNGLNSQDPRNQGVQNSIQMIDDLSDHVSRLQAEAGSYSQVLDSTVSRSDLLIVSTKILRSDVIDTDIAEATLKIQQLSLNYQALLSNISKVSKLSLVNYL